ncbi:MAG: hypothetical protein AAF411_06525, partial [Myxococcota bacterium]
GAVAADGAGGPGFNGEPEFIYEGNGGGGGGGAGLLVLRAARVDREPPRNTAITRTAAPVLVDAP